MKIIIGLGNPGKQYVNTRHNIGFRVIDEIVRQSELVTIGEELKFHQNDDFNALVAQTNHKGEKILLVKPQTFMNNSGECVAKIARFYKVKPQDIWVISDDIDLPLGSIRVRLSGSSGGHNGIESIIKNLSTEDIARIRVGVAQVDQTGMKSFDNYTPSLEAKEFVLSPFSERDLAIANRAIELASRIVIEAIETEEGLMAHTSQVK